MRLQILLTVLLVVAVGLGFGFRGVNEYGKADKIYEGKEVFSTEQEYAEFKYAIGQEDIELVESQVLSSSPPIVVDFIAHIPTGQEFAYGEYKGRDPAYTFPVVPCGILILALGILSIWSFFDEKLKRV